MNTHSTEHRSRSRNAEATRARLVRTALDLFTTRGYRTSTTAAIAARAGVAEGTIYRHFATKEQLYNEVYRIAVRRFAEPAVAPRGAETCRARLRNVAAAWRELAATDPAVVRLVLAPRREHLDARSRGSVRDLHSAIERAIAAGQERGEVRAGRSTTWAEVWMRMVTLALEHVADGTWPLDEPAADDVVGAAWDAIRVAGTDAG